MPADPRNESSNLSSNDLPSGGRDDLLDDANCTTGYDIYANKSFLLPLR